MKKKIEQALQNAYAKCHEAVEHVAMANYNEREREAYTWVNKAFQELEKSIEGKK